MSFSAAAAGIILAVTNEEVLPPLERSDNLTYTLRVSVSPGRRMWRRLLQQANKTMLQAYESNF